MASYCFWECNYPVTQKPDAAYKLSQTPEPLIGYVVCHKQLIFCKHAHNQCPKK
jgi:hypothetical protein